MHTHIKQTLAIGIAAAMLASVAGCSSPSSNGSSSSGGAIEIVAAENEYGDMAKSIGGDAVTVTSIMSNPNTDPHTFEASANVAKAIASARIVIENGLGYDDFIGKLESASANNQRVTVSAQKVLGLPDSTKNPHLWYNPDNMLKVASALKNELVKLDAKQAKTFEANYTKFQTAIEGLNTQIADFKSAHPDTTAAVTEPVADYLLERAGIKVLTPWSLQAAIMNDTDPSSQDSSYQESLFTGKKIKLFLYNQQVTDDTTTKYLNLAKSNAIPVVGVYETMPSGYHYVSWMQAELKAMTAAVEHGTSSERL